MKKIPIKFRGKDILNGNMLYGDLLHAKNELLILEFGTKVARKVAKNSVAQLVGYDADGDEVYTGDTLYFYRCFCLSGDMIRKRLKPAGVCRVIDAHCLEGLYDVSLNNDIDYSFLLKAKVAKVDKENR